MERPDYRPEKDSRLRAAASPLTLVGLLTLGLLALSPTAGAAQTRSLTIHPGETEEVTYPPGTDLAVSRRGIVDAFPAGEGRWEITALHTGFVVIDARDGATGEGRWPRLLIEVENTASSLATTAPPPPALPVPAWICRAAGVRCDQEAGIVTGEATSALWYQRARLACDGVRTCLFAVTLAPPAQDTWLASLRRALGAAYGVSATAAGVPILDVFCGRGGRPRRRDEADALTGRAVTDGLLLLRCRDEVGAARYRLSLRLWLVEETAARELGFEPAATATLTVPPRAPAGELLARLKAMELDRRADMLGQPVLRLTANQEAEVVSGGEFQVIEHVVRESRGDEAATQASWKQHGLTLKVTATPVDEHRVRLAYDVTFKGRGQASDADLTVNGLRSEVDAELGTPLMVGLLDMRADGVDGARLPWLGQLPLIGPLLSRRGTQHMSSQLLVWLDITEDTPAGPLPAPPAGPPPGAAR